MKRSRITKMPIPHTHSPPYPFPPHVPFPFPSPKYRALDARDLHIRPSLPANGSGLTHIPLIIPPCVEGTWRGGGSRSAGNIGMSLHLTSRLPEQSWSYVPSGNCCIVQ